MTQSQALYKLLSDGLPHRTDEIMEVVYGGSHLGLARVGARINELVNKGYVFLDRNGKEITEKGARRGWYDDKNSSLYWYHMKVNIFWSGKGVQQSFFQNNHSTAA